MEKLDPRVRIAVIVIMSVLCFLLRHWLMIGAALAIALLLWRAVGLGFAELRNAVRPLRLVFVLVILAQAVFYPGQTAVTVDLPWPGSIVLPVTVEGVGFGVLLCMRVLVLACTVPILTARTSVDRIVLALTKMGLPYRAAYTATTALNQIPVIRNDMVTITAAQRLRGSDAFGRGGFFRKLRAYPALVVPLVMTSMRRANLMGVAMHARAFGSGSVRTSIHTLRFRMIDGMVFCVAVGASAALLMLDAIL